MHAWPRAPLYTAFMSDAVPHEKELQPGAVPPPVLEVCRVLSEAGYAAFLVGPGLRDLLRGVRPPHFELATNASVSALASLYPTAVLIGSQHDTLMIPTRAGPVDVSSFRTGTLDGDLGHRDFSINALAYDAKRDRLLDPFGGRKHLAEGLLCAVRSARDRFDEDPLRALRGVRLAATLGLRLDPEVEAALATAPNLLGRIPREAVRRELVAILLSQRVAEAFARLEHSGIATSLAPGTLPGAGALLQLLPFDLELRLAAWLRGTRSRRILQRMRFSRPTVDRVELLLRLHPLDERPNPGSAAATARFARRTGSRDLGALIALRAAELELDPEATPAERDGLHQVNRVAEELRASRGNLDRRDRLAIGGADVMRLLDCRPGPRVGRALAYLAEQIAADPSLNSQEALAQLLSGWNDGGSPD